MVRKGTARFGPRLVRIDVVAHRVGREAFSPGGDVHGLVASEGIEHLAQPTAVPRTLLGDVTRDTHCQLKPGGSHRRDGAGGQGARPRRACPGDDLTERPPRDVTGGWYGPRMDRAGGGDPRWKLADLYKELGGVLQTADGTKAHGPVYARVLRERGDLTDAQADVLAATSEDDVKEAIGIYSLRVAYRDRVKSFRAQEVSAARLELYRQIVAGHFGYMFDDETDPTLARYATAAAMSLAPWFVTPDMCKLIEHAAPQMPDWVLAEEDLPAGGGFVVFADSIESDNNETDADVPYWLNAISFYAVQRGQDRYVQFDDWEASTADDGWTWMSSGRHSWFLGTSVDDFGRISVRPGNTEAGFQAQSAAMRRRIACLWALAKTPRLVERTEIHDPRPARPRAARSRITTPVVLFDIRATEYTGTGAERPSNWSHRWIVGGHWRNQAHGPGGRLRRPTWIAPHVKGPDDKPLVVKDRVGVVRADPPTAGADR